MTVACNSDLQEFSVTHLAAAIRAPPLGQSRVLLRICVSGSVELGLKMTVACCSDLQEFSVTRSDSESSL